MSCWELWSHASAYFSSHKTSAARHTPVMRRHHRADGSTCSCESGGDNDGISVPFLRYRGSPMPRHNCVRIALVVSGIIAAALYGTAAEENIKPGRGAASAKARRDAARKVYEGTWQHHLQAPDD